MCVYYYKNLKLCCRNEVAKKKRGGGGNTQRDEERPEARLSKKALSGVQNPSSSLGSWLVSSHLKTQGKK